MTLFYSETEVVARVEGLTVARLRAFVAAECVAPAEREGRLAFREADLARVQLLAELVRDFDLDADAAGMVVSLVDQIHGLRRALRQLGEAVAAEPGEVRDRIRQRLAADRVGPGPRNIGGARHGEAPVRARRRPHRRRHGGDGAGPCHARGGEGPATAGYAAANAAMHEAMAIEYTGDPDVDFARAMIPHHEGAIDMAEVLLANGKDPDSAPARRGDHRRPAERDRRPGAVAGRPRRQQ